MRGKLATEDPPRERDAYAVIYMPWANIHSRAMQMFPSDEHETYPDRAYYPPWPTFHAGDKAMLTYAGICGFRLVPLPPWLPGPFVGSE